MSYYIFQNDETKGPFSIDQLRSMWSSGTITGQTLYCQEGYSEWLPLSQLQAELGEPPQLPPQTSASPEAAETLDVGVQKAPKRTYDVLLCVFGLLSLFAHFASPVAIILVSLAFFFWSRREGKKTWYRTVGLVAAIISLGGTVFYLGLALLVWLHIMIQ